MITQNIIHHLTRYVTQDHFLRGDTKVTQDRINKFSKNTAL